MPREVFGQDYRFLPQAEVLTFEEIARLAGIFVGLGVRKVRLTGGEPLLRRDIERLVAMLAEVAGLEDLTLTTNGSLLARKADALAAAGLQRISVSLDSLDDAVFAQLNDVAFPVRAVLAGIEAADRAGLHPIKVNMVVRRGLNEGSVLPMARFVARARLHPPVHRVHGRRPLERLAPRRGRPVGRDRRADRRRDAARGDAAPVRGRGRGPLAVPRRRTARSASISSVSEPFCGSCTRARITAEGQLFTCLFGVRGTDLRGPLRAGADDEELLRLVEGVWAARADRYSELRGEATARIPKVEMSRIGG